MPPEAPALTEEVRCYADLEAENKRLRRFATAVKSHVNDPTLSDGARLAMIRHTIMKLEEK